MIEMAWNMMAGTCVGVCVCVYVCVRALCVCGAGAVMAAWCVPRTTETTSWMYKEANTEYVSLAGREEEGEDAQGSELGEGGVSPDTPLHVGCRV